MHNDAPNNGEFDSNYLEATSTAVNSQSQIHKFEQQTLTLVNIIRDFYGQERRQIPAEANSYTP